MKKLVTAIVAQPLFLALSVSTALANHAPDHLFVPAPENVPVVEIGNVISAVVGILLVIAAILAFLYLILGGIQWITSGGDKTGMEAARNKITAAIVGLIIVAAAWAIMLLIGRFVGFDLLGSGGVTLPTIENPNPNP
jgi:hypothetical protein